MSQRKGSSGSVALRISEVLTIAPSATDKASTTLSAVTLPPIRIGRRTPDSRVRRIRESDSGKLRPVTISRYTERSAVVSSGLAEGERLVLAGVHTVYEGEQVAPVKPLFTDEDAASAAVLASAP